MWDIRKLDQPFVGIGKRLRSERKRLGLTQQQLADALDIAKNTQSNYERGTRQPPADYLSGAAKLGMDISAVLMESNERVTAPEADAQGGFKVGEPELPYRRAPRADPSGAIVNPVLLTECLVAVEEELRARQASLASLQKARVMIALYEMSLPFGAVNRGVVGPLLAVAGV